MTQSLRFAILFALAPCALSRIAAAEDAADTPQTQPALPHVTVLGNTESDNYRVE